MSPSFPLNDRALPGEYNNLTATEQEVIEMLRVLFFPFHVIGALIWGILSFLGHILSGIASLTIFAGLTALFVSAFQGFRRGWRGC